MVILVSKLLKLLLLPSCKYTNYISWNHVIGLILVTRYISKWLRIKVQVVEEEEVGEEWEEVEEEIKKAG